MDEEGYIRINGRLKDIIIRGGELDPEVQALRAKGLEARGYGSDDRPREDVRAAFARIEAEFAAPTSAPFHRVFAMFRGAVGSAGVAIRGDLGNEELPHAARIGRRLARASAGRALVLIEENP